ncbi:MAG: hypothetical protein DCF13_13330 [Flavobacteriaceae bacterium]|nr:MAG: hypothetical protein DCF13_13330 [Flavobacteriaceae bacterium]
MHLNIDLLAKTKNIYKWERESIKYLDKISEGDKNYLITKESKFIVYHKVSNSLKYFRRSVKSVSKEDKIINYNIAIESLLLDNEGKKREKIIERARKSIKYFRNKENHIKNLNNIVSQRNHIVHNAKMNDKGFDMILAYRLYCKIVSFIAKNIEDIEYDKPKKMELFYKKY